MPTHAALLYKNIILSTVSYDPHMLGHFNSLISGFKEEQVITTTYFPLTSCIFISSNRNMHRLHSYIVLEAIPFIFLLQRSIILWMAVKAFCDHEYLWFSYFITLFYHETRMITHMALWYLISCMIMCLYQF